MANRRRGLLGGLVCFVLGAVIGVCALAGVLVWVVKLGTINKVTNREIVGSTEVDGETVDLKEMTVWDIITKASSLGDTSKKMTLKNVEELLPALNLTDMLPAEMLNEDKTALSVRYNGTEILTVSLDELYSQQFSSIAKYVEATVKNNLKFSTLTAVGMNLDAFPFVRGYAGSDAANPGKEVPTYVSLGTGTIGEYYKNHPASVYYVAEDGAYHTATDAMISRADGDQTALYFKAVGLGDLPILDGINAIVATLDVDTLTLDAMNDKFGLNLTDEKGNYKNAVLAKISDIRVSHFADEIDNVMNRLYLSDVLTGLEEDDVLYPLQFLRYTKDTAAEYNAAHADEISAGSKNAVQPGDFVEDENGDRVLASINQLSGNISYLKVKDLINNPDDNALIAALGDYTVDDLQNKADTIVDGLYLSDVMNISQDNMMAAFEYMRYTDLKNEDGTPKEGSAQAYNDAHADKTPVKPGDYILDENGNKVKTTIGKLSEIIDFARIEDMIKNESDNRLVAALGKHTLKELRTNGDTIVNGMDISDVMNITEDSMMSAFEYMRYTDLKNKDGTPKEGSAQAYNDAHAAEIAAGTKAAVKPGDYVLDEKGNKVRTTVGKLSEIIDYVKVKDLIKNDSNNEMVSALGEYTLKELRTDADGIMDDLALSDVIEIKPTDTALSALQYLRFTEKTAADYNTEHAAEIAAGTAFAVKAGDKIPVWENGMVKKDEEDNIVYTLTTIKTLGGNINNVPMGDLLGVTEGSEPILRAISGATVNTLNDTVKTLTLADVMTIDESNAALNALQYLRFTEKTAAEYNTEHAAEIAAGTASAVKAGDKIPVWEDGRVKKDEEGNIVYTLTTIKTLSGNVNNVPMGDLLNITDDSEPVLKAIRYATIKTLNDTVKDLTLSDVMTIDESNAAMNALQYLRFTETAAADYNAEHAAEIAAGTASAVKAGDKIPVWEDGVIKTDEAGNIVYRKAKVNELGGNINNVKMGDLLNVTEGSEPILRAISGATVNTLNDTVKTLTLADVMTIETDPAKPGYSKILVSLQGEKITDLGSATNRLTLADAIDIETDPNKAGYSKILVSLQNSKITELGSAASGLTLADAIDIETDESSPNYSKTLIALKDAKLTELGTKIPALTLGEMLPYDESGTTFYDKLMKQDAIRNATANTAGTAISNVKIASLFDVYEADGGELKGIWYFVLSGNESLDDLDGVMANAPTKFGSAKLGDLARKGLLGDIQESDLNASVKNMTLNEAIKAFNSAASSGLIGG